MSRWLRVVRGMIGTGLAFAAGVGGAASAVGALVWLGGGVTGLELLQIAGKFSVVAFLLGVTFSGALAITARTRLIREISLRVGSALGAGAGLLYWAFLAVNGGRNWSARNAIGNLVILLLMGAGAATATLMIARRGRVAQMPGDEAPGLGAGDDEIVRARRGSKVEVPKR